MDVERSYEEWLATEHGKWVHDCVQKATEGAARLSARLSDLDTDLDPLVINLMPDATRLAFEAGYASGRS